MAVQIETVPVGSIKPDPANARTHDAKNLAAIKGSLEQFGQQKPIVVDGDGIVLAGNGTLAAAIDLGWSEILIARTALTGAKARAYALADNRSSELAQWDDEFLTSTLKTLQEGGFDIGSIGFDGFDISAPPAEGLTDPDAVPENVETRCKPGDLWQLGEHRLLCGDSTNVQHVERLMGGEKADICFTSPPYNLIACEKTGRRCFGMEIDPKYCDVILKRWEDFTGQTAVLSPEGSPNGG